MLDACGMADGRSWENRDANDTAVSARDLHTPSGHIDWARLRFDADIGAPAFERGDILDLRSWRSGRIGVDLNRLAVVPEMEFSTQRPHTFRGVEERSRNVEVGDQLRGAGGSSGIFVVDLSLDLDRGYFDVVQAHVMDRVTCRHGLR